MKADLDRQIARLSEFAASRRLAVIEVVKEIGSGLNGHRRAVLKILRNPKVHTVVLYPSLRRKTWFLQRRRNRLNYKYIMRMEASLGSWCEGSCWTHSAWTHNTMKNQLTICHLCAGFP
jgi:predicted site-specific integrase-resolvase